MAVALGTVAESVRTDTSDPYNFNFTPAATARGIAVAVVHGVSSTDHVTGITYGGVAMGRVVRATDTATELGAAELWFLGSGIPTGLQTISVNLASGTTDDLHIVVMSVTANADTEIVDFDSLSNNVANPSVTLQYGGRTCLSIAALYGGGADGTAFTPNANCTTIHDHDLGAFFSEVIRQTTPGSADFAIGGTASSDDVAYVAMAISEVVSVTTVTPTPAVMKFVVPTPTVAAGAVTNSPSPAVAKFVVPTPTVVKGAVTIAPGAAQARFVVPTPEVRNGVTITPTPAQARFLVPTPAIVRGTVTLTPGAAVARFAVPTPTVVRGAVTLTVGAAAARFIVPSPTVQLGARVLTIGTAIGRWLVPTPAVVRGTVTLGVTPASARFIVPVVTLLKGAAQLTPTAARAFWRVPSPSMGGPQIVTPSAAVARWLVPIVDVTNWTPLVLPAANVHVAVPRSRQGAPDSSHRTVSDRARVRSIVAGSQNNQES